MSGFPTAKALWEAKVTAGARLRREEEDAENVGWVGRCLRDGLLVKD